MSCHLPQFGPILVRRPSSRTCASSRGQSSCDALLSRKLEMENKRVTGTQFYDGMLFPFTVLCQTSTLWLVPKCDPESFYQTCEQPQAEGHFIA